MRLKVQLRHLLDRVLYKLGYRLVNRSQDMSSILSLSEALGRVLSRDLAIISVIDVGASNGMWTKVARRFLPGANYLLVDANPVHESALKDYVARVPNTAYALVAAGDADGTIYFDVSTPFGGVAAHDRHEGYVEQPVRSIDSLVAEHQLMPPYLLKLDTHGFEVPIFEGAAKTLEQTNLIIVEVYNIPGAKALSFDAMCRYLGEKGFRVIDLCDPMFREYDQAFWQADFFFIRADRKEFQYLGYQ